MKTIDADSLSRKLEEGRVRLLDVLPASSFRRVHIPGAESRPLPELKKRARDLLERGEEIVVYCSGPDCGLSSAAAAFLEETGYGRVYDFEGGLAEWIRSGRDVIRNGRRTTPMTATNEG